MTATKRSLAALLIALTLFVAVHKPSDHEQHAESPTESEAEAFVDDKLPAPKPKPAEQPEVQPVSTVKTVDTVQPAKQPEPSAAEFIATFYVAECAGCSGITSTGIDVRNTIHHEGLRVIAVDPSVIPLKSKVLVKMRDGSTFTAIAGDTGGKIKGLRVDILVASRDEAIRLGRQPVTVEIIQVGGVN